MTSPATHHPTFVVPLKDLDDGPKTLEAEISVAWLAEALDTTEATPAGETGQLNVVLSKNGHEVLVRGHVAAPVIVPCARTLAPIRLELKAELLLLLRRVEPANPRPRSRASEGTAVTSLHGKRGRTERNHPTHRLEGRGPKGHSKKAPKHRARSGWPEDPELSTHDAALDTFEGEKIVLDPFVREFLLLELPMFPVRQDLPSLPVEARASAPGSAAEPAASGESSAEPQVTAAPPLDPRLAPLAALKDRLGQKKKQ